MKIRLSFLALGLVALLGSLLASSQRISAYEATDRLAASAVSGPSVLGTGKAPLGAAIPAPGITLTYTTYLPLIMKPVQGIYGYLTQSGAPVGGISLDLWFSNGSSDSVVTTTTTDSSGFYLFTDIPALGAGQVYYVEYMNPEYDDSRLGYWWSADVTSYTTSSVVDLGTADIANIALAAPSPGAIVTLPYLFQWTPRPATPSDSYFYVLFIPNTYVYASTSLLGYVGSVPITHLPNGFYPNVPYGWYVAVLDSSGGVGSSYYYRGITFLNVGASVSGPLNLAPRLTGRRTDPPPRPRPEK